MRVPRRSLTDAVRATRARRWLCRAILACAVTSLAVPPANLLPTASPRTTSVTSMSSRIDVSDFNWPLPSLSPTRHRPVTGTGYGACGTLGAGKGPVTFQLIDLPNGFDRSELRARACWDQTAQDAYLTTAVLSDVVITEADGTVYGSHFVISAQADTGNVQPVHIRLSAWGGAGGHGTAVFSATPDRCAGGLTTEINVTGRTVTGCDRCTSPMADVALADANRDVAEAGQGEPQELGGNMSMGLAEMVGGPLDQSENLLLARVADVAEPTASLEDQVDTAAEPLVAATDAVSDPVSDAVVQTSASRDFYEGAASWGRANWDRGVAIERLGAEFRPSPPRQRRLARPRLHPVRQRRLASWRPPEDGLAAQEQCRQLTRLVREDRRCQRPSRGTLGTRHRISRILGRKTQKSLGKTRTTTGATPRYRAWRRSADRRRRWTRVEPRLAH